MASYNFDEYIERKGTNASKWEMMKKISPLANDKTLPFWVADMDFACPPEVIEALHQKIEDRIFGYSFPDDDYFKSVSGWFNRRFDWQVNGQDIFIVSGVVPAIDIIISAFSAPGDGIIIQPPVYHKFADIIRVKRRRIVNNSLINENGVYSIDVDDLQQKAADPNNKVMLFCSPHNPTGNVWNAEVLKKVGQICLDNDVLLVSDEIHCDLVRQGVKHIPLASLFPESDKIITCTSPSKTFNMAGMQMSNILIQNATYQATWRQWAGFSTPSPLGIAAVKAAYLQGETWLAALQQYIDGNFAFAVQFIRDKMPKAKFIVPEGTYFIWLDLSDYGLSVQEMNQCLIQQANVLLECGTVFGKQGAGYQRINIACPQAMLAEGLTRMSEALYACTGS